MRYDDVLYGVVIVWLGLISAIDLRQRRLPIWAARVPLACLVGLYLGLPIGTRSVLDHWPVVLLVRGMALGFAFLAALLSNTWAAGVPAAISLALAFGWETAFGATVVAWLVALLFARAGLFGGGDAKVVMILMALFPDRRLAAALLGAELVGSLVVLRRRYGWRGTLQRIAHAVRLARRGELPATGARWATTVPGVPKLAAGALAYLVLARLLDWQALGVVALLEVEVF